MPAVCRRTSLRELPLQAYGIQLSGLQVPSLLSLCRGAGREDPSDARGAVLVCLTMSSASHSARVDPYIKGKACLEGSRRQSSLSLTEIAER